jgi:hypothetical protein
VLLMLFGAVAILLTFLKTFGSQAPVNHTPIEIIAARSWCACLPAVLTLHAC